MRQTIPIALGVALVAAAGLVHRRWASGSDDAPALAAAVANIERVPLTIGAWHGTPLEMDAVDLANGRYAGALWRRYEDRATGRVVSMLLVCGRPGRVSVHTPDACYLGAGFVATSEPARVTLTLPGGVGQAQLWHARYVHPQRPAEPPVSVYWSWTGGTRWQAVDSPRLAFAGLPVLYKLYVVCESSATAANPGSDPAAEFARSLLPELDAILTPAAPGSDTRE